MSTLTSGAGNPAPKNSLTLVIVAAVLGVIAVVMNGYFYQQAKRGSDITTFTLYYLNKAVQPGHKFDAKKDVDSMSVPVALREGFQGAVNADALANLDKKEILRSANRTTPITQSLFSPDFDAASLAVPPPGKVAFQLPVNSTNSPANLRANAFVDIWATVEVPGLAPKVTRVMEHVKVAQVGDGRRTTSYRGITLHIDHEDVNKLLYVQRFLGGAKSFDLTLRNPSDRGVMVGVDAKLLKELGYK